MELNISPLDNRYKNKCDPLREYVSDFGFNKIRYEVELRYFEFLLDTLYNKKVSFDSLINNFSIEDLENIREIESRTNHDVKSIEYFIKNQIESKDEFKDIVKYKELVHFALTSQDINSVSNSILLRRSIEGVIVPKIKSIISLLLEYSDMWSHKVMMSKTHGQPAVTTSMGKEIKVFIERLLRQVDLLDNFSYTTKLGGAVGNLNAHYFCYENINWDRELENFLFKSFNLYRNRYTTQIDHYDNFSEVFDIIKRINIILIDLNQDFWTYISQNYFILKKKEGEVGSSTMPHKINPINFENSEGNLYLANSLLNMMSQKLPISRLQRDLTDSTITRNIGVALSYSLLAYQSLEQGLHKIEINQASLDSDLDDNWCILTEAIQCIMKTELKENAYEAMKEVSRGNKITKEEYIKIVNNLDISISSKAKLLRLTPSSYTGNLLAN